MKGGVAIRRAKRHAAVLAGVGLVCLVGPWVWPYAPEAQDTLLGAAAPSWRHWLGTDLLGRDLLARLMEGGRVSIGVGLAATVVSLVIGVTWGSVAGYAEGRVDRLMMRIVDVLYALPFTIFVIVLTVAFGRSLLLLFVAIGAVEWLTMARIVRAETLSLKQRPFVEAAVLVGLPAARILFRHVVPNLLGPVLVYATLTVPRVMLLEAFMSFLGLGVQPPMSSWGTLIRDGVEVMEEFPWMLLGPATVFALTLYSLNALGDALRDTLDPTSD